jgi:hypothetical protein
MRKIESMKKTVAVILIAPVVAMAAERPLANADEAPARRYDASRVETERIYLSGRGCDDAVEWSFEMKDGSTVRFDLLEESPYVGAFSPSDGRDEFLFQPPKLGVSVLAVCPATGNKFAPPKDVSPSGRSVVPSGAVTGRVRVSLIPPAAHKKTVKGEYDD